MINRNVDLPHLGDDLFRRVLLPWNVLILLDAIRHASSRTTAMGVDHRLMASANYPAMAARTPIGIYPFDVNANGPIGTYGETGDRPI